MPQYPASFQNAYNKFLASQVKYNQGETEYSEFEAAYKELEVKAHKTRLNIAMYDEANERRPRYPSGDNSNRSNFTYGPKNKKFQTMHRIMKPAVIAFINKVHKWVLAKWDKDAYVYDVCRMRILDNAVHDFIDQYFDHEDRKLDFMRKGADICLFFMKEDIYYASRVFHLLNCLPFFVLKQEERENIATFTRGIDNVCGFTNEPALNNTDRKFRSL